jgi:hypothetical protein
MKWFELPSMQEPVSELQELRRFYEDTPQDWKTIRKSIIDSKLAERTVSATDFDFGYRPPVCRVAPCAVAPDQARYIEFFLVDSWSDSPIKKVLDFVPR